MSERVCTSCGQVLARFGHFVRTPGGSRHGACPPGPSEALALALSPVGFSVTAPKRPKPPLTRYFTCQCMDAKHGSATGCSGSGDEVTRLCAFCVADKCQPTPVQTAPALKSNVNAVAAPTPPPEPAEAAPADPLEDETDDTSERCIRCGRGLGANGYWVGTAAGRRHSVCPPKARPAVAVAEAAPAPVLPAPARRAPAPARPRRVSHSYRGRSSLVAPAALEPATEAPTEPPTEPPEDQTDETDDTADTGERCVRRGGPGASGYWVIPAYRGRNES